MSSNAVPTESDKIPRLRYFHIAFFAIVLSLGGSALAVQKTAATVIRSALDAPATALVYVTTAILALTALACIVKVVRYPGTVSEELSHLAKINSSSLVAKILLVSSVVFSIEMCARLSTHGHPEPHSRFPRRSSLSHWGSAICTSGSST